MASVGHLAVGLAAARFQADDGAPRLPALALWPALSLLPDLDVIGFAMGVDYGAPWGHRGASHSLVMSVAVGTIVGFAAWWFRGPAVKTGVMATAVLASHGLLDCLTDGGLGSALWWPFDHARYFAPWRPIPVAPIGFGLVSAYGAAVVLVELILFAPVFVFALGRGRPRPVTVALVLVSWAAVVIAVSRLSTRDVVLAFLSRDDTEFAAGFSEAAFAAVRPGDSEAHVQKLLGAPYSEIWLYTVADDRSPDDRPLPTERACLLIALDGERVERAFHPDACAAAGLVRGSRRVDVDQRLGPPREACWQYSRGGDGALRGRVVCFTGGAVRAVWRGRH